MLFVTNTVDTTDLQEVNNFFNEFEAVETVDVNETQEPSNVSLYLTSLVSGQYQKSIEDIQGTKVGSSIKRRKNLQQVMKESFFYGANRFGTNFIA